MSLFASSKYEGSIRAIPNKRLKKLMKIQALKENTAYVVIISRSKNNGNSRHVSIL
jgi:hypothetical protein